MLLLAGRTNLNLAGMEMRYVDDARRSYADFEPIHTLPRLAWSSRLPLVDTQLALAWDSEYLNYYRDQGLGYQRLDLFPRLIAPLPLGRFLEGTIGGGLRETIYRVKTQGDPVDSAWTGTSSPNRNAWEIKGNLATIFGREYQPDWQHLSRFTHLFRPNLGYLYLDPGEQNDLPDLDGLDRLDNAKRIYWQLNNYFMAAGRDRGNRPYARQLGHFKLSQYYDLHEAHRQLAGPADQRQPYSDLDLDLELAPVPALGLRYQTTFDMYGDGATAYLFQVRYHKDERQNLLFDYNYARGTARDLTLNLQFPFTNQVAARYATTFSLLEDHKSYESLSLLYTPRCWALEVTVAADSEDRRLMLVYTLNGIGKALEIDQSGL
jgi:LPS-assembly protein